MIRDGERREGAARLRELSSDTYAASKEWGEGWLFIDASLSDEADYSQIHNAVLGCFPSEHMHPGDYEELHERLADLIDRPTCRIWYVPGSADRSCSACGVTFSTGTYHGGDHDEHEFMFCPNCGAMVTEEDGINVRKL